MDLDDDCWCLIFEKLKSSNPDDRTSFGLTSHRFLHIQNLCLKSLRIGCFFRLSCSTHATIDIFTIDKLLNRFTQLRTLTLGCCLDVSIESSLYLLRKYGSKLQSLDLRFSRRITNTGLTSVAAGCPLLCVFSLSFSSITDSGLEILTTSCKSLKEVNLVWCTNLTDRGISSLNQNCRQLRALNIAGCGQIRGASFQGFSPTLSYLKADACAFDSAGISGIVSGGCLEYLDLSSPLRYQYHPSTVLAPIGFASKLKILKLYDCAFVEDDDIIQISRGCPLLQHWNLSGCNKIGNAGWESIGSYCQNLESLHVCGCDNFCDPGLLAIGAGCKRLSVIYIRECWVTNGGVHMFRLQRQDVEIKDDVKCDCGPSWEFTISTMN